MNPSKQAIRVELVLGTLNPFFPGPTGPADGILFSDGTFLINLTQSKESIKGDAGVRFTWSYGLIDGVDEEHLYLGVAPMVYAKVVKVDDNQSIEAWLRENHPR
jgi:hypothetical protein